MESGEGTCECDSDSEQSSHALEVACDVFDAGQPLEVEVEVEEDEEEIGALMEAANNEGAFSVLLILDWKQDMGGELDEAEETVELEVDGVEGTSEGTGEAPKWSFASSAVGVTRASLTATCSSCGVGTLSRRGSTSGGAVLLGSALADAGVSRIAA